MDKAKEVGQNILKIMTHKNTEEYTFKKDKQAITMEIYMCAEVVHKEIQVDPQLLFQRLIAVRNYMQMKMWMNSLSINYVLFQPLCLSPTGYQERQTSRTSRGNMESH